MEASAGSKSIINLDKLLLSGLQTPGSKGTGEHLKKPKLFLGAPRVAVQEDDLRRSNSSIHKITRIESKKFKNKGNFSTQSEGII